jgi:hypothetical protein
VSGATVRVAIGSNPTGGFLGGTLSETVVNGLATFSDLSLNEPGTGYTLTVTVAGLAASATTNPISITGSSKAAATLTLGNLSFMYDGSPHNTVATTSPAGLSGVAISYSQNGVAVAQPTNAGSYTVTATLNNPDYIAQAAIGTLVIAQATPVITWPAPASITVGTPLSSTQLDATASFDGTVLPGTYTYNLAAGTVLAVGDGQVLSVTFAPTDGSDWKTVTGYATIDVLPKSTTTEQPLVLIGELPIFARKHNKNGRAALTGFRLQFNIPLADSGGGNPADYQIETVKIKKVKNGLARVLQPFKAFTVTNHPESESVTINLIGTRTFPSGGLITLLPGITTGSNSVLTGGTSVTISPGGKALRPT